MTTLATIVAVEAAVHVNPLCAAVVPAHPAATIEEAIAAGRATAAAVAGTPDVPFEVSGRPYGGRAFLKNFIQGTSGHGAAFVPIGNAIVAMTHPTRSVTYTDEQGRAVYGVVGIRDGEALGILLGIWGCPPP